MGRRALAVEPDGRAFSLLLFCCGVFSPGICCGFAFILLVSFGAIFGVCEVFFYLKKIFSFSFVDSKCK